MLRFFRKMRKALVPENRFGRYFFYAIGEIVLVVIGILIALQINNWNEDRKNENLAEIYTKNVVKDLEKDSIAINMHIQRLNKEDSIFISMQKRLTSPNCTKDTLIQIVRYEFNPVAPGIQAFNNNTFRSLESSGNIILLHPWLHNALFELDKKQRELEVVMGQTMNPMYYKTAPEFGNHYTFNFKSTLLNSGELNQLIWTDIDVKQLASRFNGLIVLKQTKLVTERMMLLRIYELTIETLEKIRNQ